MILLNNLLIYITFIILFQFLIDVNSQSTTFKPDLREAHTATFINDKLYILGGSIVGTKLSPKEEFLYLDFPTPFKANVNKLEWHVLSNDTVPSHRYAATVKGGANNNTLFLYGGESLIDETMALVYTFDTSNNLWRIPEMMGMPQNKEIGSTLAIDYNGLMYLYGGVTGEYGGTYTNDMFILD